MAKRDDIELWFEDECHFQQHGSRCAMWVPPEEKDPVVLHAPTRKSIAYFGAVHPADGRLISMRSEVFNAQTFGAFLKKVSKNKGKKKAIVVVDNARWHHAAILGDWLRAHRNSIKLMFLPPYSPELNPIERAWKLLRRLCIHNQHFEELAELVRIVSKQLLSWKKPNETLHKLCAII